MAATSRFSRRLRRFSGPDLKIGLKVRQLEITRDKRMFYLRQLRYIHSACLKTLPSAIESPLTFTDTHQSAQKEDYLNPFAKWNMWKSPPYEISHSRRPFDLSLNARLTLGRMSTLVARGKQNSDMAIFNVKCTARIRSTLFRTVPVFTVSMYCLRVIIELQTAPGDHYSFT